MLEWCFSKPQFYLLMQTIKANEIKITTKFIMQEQEIFYKRFNLSKILSRISILNMI